MDGLNGVLDDVLRRLHAVEMELAELRGFTKSSQEDWRELHDEVDELVKEVKVLTQANTRREESAATVKRFWGNVAKVVVALGALLGLVESVWLNWGG